jgi:predicted RNase H-like nuclease
VTEGAGNAFAMRRSGVRIPAASPTTRDHPLCGSVSAFNLRPKLREVEALAFTGAYRVVEVHPEMSFARLAGGPLPAAKKTAEGQQQRRELLSAAGISVSRAVSGAAVDDVLDAAVVAWSAQRVATGDAEALPDPPEAFSDGWPSAIWV